MASEKNIEQNINRTGESNILVPIPIGSSLSVDIVPAIQDGEQPLLGIVVYNDGNSTLWIKLQPAATDNDKKGIPIFAGEKEEILKFGNNYDGAWSAIMNAGAEKNVYVTYW